MEAAAAQQQAEQETAEEQAVGTPQQQAASAEEQQPQPPQQIKQQPVAAGAAMRAAALDSPVPAGSGRGTCRPCAEPCTPQRRSAGDNSSSWNESPLPGSGLECGEVQSPGAWVACGAPGTMSCIRRQLFPRSPCCQLNVTIGSIAHPAPLHPPPLSFCSPGNAAGPAVGTAAALPRRRAQRAAAAGHPQRAARAAGTGASAGRLARLQRVGLVRGAARALWRLHRRRTGAGPAGLPLPGAV